MNKRMNNEQDNLRLFGFVLLQRKVAPTKLPPDESREIKFIYRHAHTQTCLHTLRHTHTHTHIYILAENIRVNKHYKLSRIAVNRLTFIIGYWPFVNMNQNIDG